MIRFAARRLLAALPVALGVALLGFLLLCLVPGDPASAYLGERASPKALEALRHEMGLDRSLPVRLGRYARGLLKGDLGKSLRTRSAVSEDLGRALPATAELAGAALLLSALVGVPLGVLAALRPGSWRDLGISALAMAGLALPVFWVGLSLSWLLGVHGPGLPFDGRLSPEREIPERTGLLLADTLLAGDGAAFRDALSHLALPALTLAMVPGAMLLRISRARMREALSDPCILSARAKGLSAARVVWRHAFPLALPGILTAAGLQAGALLGGAALTETVFSWPGMGRYLVDAVSARDYPALQGALLASGGIFLLANLGVDLACAWLDPRMRT